MNVSSPDIASYRVECRVAALHFLERIRSGNADFEIWAEAENTGQNGSNAGCDRFRGKR